MPGRRLGPNQGWSLDDQITDGTNYARVVTGAITGGKIDPTKTGVLMKGSVPPTWSGAFTYVSDDEFDHVELAASLAIARADGTTTAVANGSLAVTGLAAGTQLLFLSLLGRSRAGAGVGWAGSPEARARRRTRLARRSNAAAQQQGLQGRFRCPRAR